MNTPQGMHKFSGPRSPSHIPNLYVYFRTKRSQLLCTAAQGLLWSTLPGAWRRLGVTTPALPATINHLLNFQFA